MKDNDKIKDLFSKKLGNFEAKVNPTLWENIASQVATQSTVVTTGVSVITKIIIGVFSAAAITGLIFYSFSTTVKETQLKKEQPSTALTENTVVKKESLQYIKEAETEKEALEQPFVKEIENKERSKESNNFIEPIVESNRKESLPQLLEKDLVVKEEFIEKNNPVQQTEEFIKTVEETIPNKEKESETSNSNTQTKEVVEEDAYFVEKMPNVFSPNNDGVNDIFMINSTGLEQFSLVVMDAQNRMVYRTNNPEFKWDGIGLDGQQAPKGRYVYYITAVDKRGNPVNKYSILTIR